LTREWPFLRDNMLNPLLNSSDVRFKKNTVQISLATHDKAIAIAFVEDILQEGALRGARAVRIVPPMQNETHFQVKVERLEGWSSLLEVDTHHYKLIVSHLQELFQFPDIYEPPYYLPIRIPMGESGELRIDIFHEPHYWQIDFLAENEERNSRRKNNSQQSGGVKGSLQDMGVGEVLQIMGMGRKRQMLLLHHNEGDAKVYIDRGIVMHAELPPYTGFEVIPAILKWHVGTFEIHPMDKEPAATINLPIDQVLLEASRQLDES